jgi:dipeptidase E
MADRHVVALGGGGISTEDPALDRYVVDLAGVEGRPRVCYLPTASPDPMRSIVRFHDAFPARSFETSVLRLFDRTVEDLDAFLGEQHVILVSGGNTLNMLAIWRLHGVDVALRGAWEAGVVMSGSSAGANCWFEACTTDSYLIGRADPLRDGLGFLPGSFTPHYSSEPARRPSLHAHIASGALPAGIACDDFAAVHFVGTEMVEAVASTTAAGAYRVGVDDGVVEEPIPVTVL